MEQSRADGIAAGIVQVAHTLLPFLVIVNVLDWSGEAVASGTLVVSAFVTLGGWIFARRKVTTGG